MARMATLSTVMTALQIINCVYAYTVRMEGTDDNNKENLLDENNIEIGLLLLKELGYYSAVFFFFLCFLYGLVRIVKKDLSRVYPKQKRDDFYDLNGYTYDFVLIFKVRGDDEKGHLNEYQKMYTMKNIILRLEKGNLECKFFYSCQRDEVYVKIRASPQRLEYEAYRIEYKLQLDPEKLRSRLHVGFKGVWEPIVISDEYQQSALSPYDFIYGPFLPAPELRSLYKVYCVDEQTQKKQVFQCSDRLKLIVSILENKTTMNPPCCGLSLRELIANESLVSAFALHNYDELQGIIKKWIKFFQQPYKQPIDIIRSYFGERLALYFLFLQYYVTNLFVPSILGTVCHLINIYYDNDESNIIPFLTAYMVCWASHYIALWYQYQSRKAMEWGVVGFESEQQDRPQFRGEMVANPVDGGEFTYFSHRDRVGSTVAVAAGMFLALIVVEGVCVAMAFLLWHLQSTFVLTYGGIDFNAVITSVVLAVLINALSNGFLIWGVFLNDVQNHRTDTDYEDSLVTKVFAFQFFNANSFCFYVAFVKQFLGLHCTNNNCMAELKIVVSTIFITNLIIRFVYEIMYRSYAISWTFVQETSGLEPGLRPSPIEMQALLVEFDDFLQTMNDYTSISLQYNYTVLYVCANPWFPLLALVAGFVQMRVDAWKIAVIHRRPLPKPAEDIGVWQDALEFLSIMSIIFSFGLIIFTGTFCKDIDWKMRWAIFIMVEYGALILKYLFSSRTEKQGSEVEMQLARQEFIVSKVLRNKPDDREITDERLAFKKQSVTDIFEIYKTDEDWFIDKDHEEEKVDPAKTS